MFFPYGDDNPRERFPIVTVALIVTNFAIYIASMSQGMNSFRAIIQEYGYKPAAPSVLTAFASMFLHGDPLHVFWNLWFLWLFGDNIEDRIGKIFFLLFYLLSGLCGVALHSALIVGTDATRPLVGASGAISGVMAAYLVLYPWAKINFFYWFWYIYFGVVQIPAIFVIGLWFLGQVALASFTHGMANITVAYWGHVGGFSFGLAIVGILRLVHVIRKPTDIMLDSSPQFQRAIRPQETETQIPSEPAPLKERAREGLRIRTSSLEIDRSKKALQLLLRALEQNDKNRVVELYSLFEQAFPTVALPEEKQWQAAEILGQAGNDTLALEACRKIVDKYPNSEHWPQAALRTAQLYHLHHNYGRAKEYAEKATKRDPESVAGRQARELLQDIEQSLNAVETEIPEEASDAAGSYAVIRQSFEQINAAQIGDIVAEATGEHKIDARRKVVREQGILATGLLKGKAKFLASRLQSEGVPVLICPERQLLFFPEATVVNNGDLSEEKAVFNTYDQNFEFGWKRVWMINCARVRTITEKKYVSASAQMPMPGRYSQSLHRISAPRKITERKRIHVLDLLLVDPLMHIRIFENKFNYNYLPGERIRGGRSANFPLLVKDVIRFASQAHIGPGIDRLLSEESFNGLTFKSTKDLDRHIHWLAQLCHLTPKAMNREG